MAKAQGVVQNLGPIGEAVATNVKRMRGRLSYRELSDRLSEIGRPIPVLGLSRIESGARRVDVDDLLALALALGVPPVVLLADPRAGETAPYFGGSRTVVWDLFLWVAGLRVLGSDDGAPTQPDNVAFVTLAHAIANVMWRIAQAEDQRRQIGEELFSDKLDEVERGWLKSLALDLADLRRHGVPAPPRLPDDVRAAADRLGVDLPIGKGA